MPKKKKGEDDGSHMMSLPECAHYLHLSETTILKLASSNELPGVMVDKKWRFERGLVDEWLQERLNIGGEDGIEELPDPMRVPLGDLLPSEGVLENLSSSDPLNVIEELAALAYSQGWLNDKPWFVGAVVERESLSSTAMENGVAFLHTRSREASKIARPFIIVGRSYHGVDFGAPDGKPTFLFFMLGLKYDRLHLPILGRLARTMLNPQTSAKLRAQPSATKIRAVLLKEDARALAENKQVPVHYEAFTPTLDRQMRLRTIMRLNALRKHEAKKATEPPKKTRKGAAARSLEAADSAGKTTKAPASGPKSTKPDAAASAQKKSTKPGAAASAQKKSTKPGAAASAQKKSTRTGAAASAQKKSTRTGAAASAQKKSTKPGAAASAQKKSTKPSVKPAARAEGAGKKKKRISS